MPRIITVASGKGGVGKTNISVNTALCLASRGYRTCLFDADMGLANVDILLGYYPEYTLEDVLLGSKCMKDIIIKDESGLDIIPGSSGVKMLADPEPGQLEFLIESLSGLDEYDYFIFDTSAGISKNVIAFCMASPEIVLVITPEPTSITDAYALLKVLCLNRVDSTVMVAVNQCANVEVADRLYSKFKEVVYKNLRMNIFPLGTVPVDAHIAKAVREQKPIVSLYPDSDAAKGIKNIARYLVNNVSTDLVENSLSGFWKKCLDRMNSDIVMTPARKKKKTESAPRELSLVQKKTLREQGAEASVPAEPVSAEKTSGEVSAKGDQIDAQYMFKILEGLTQGINNISQELGAIRKMMENDRNNSSGRDSSSVRFRT